MLSIFAAMLNVIRLSALQLGRWQRLSIPRRSLGVADHHTSHIRLGLIGVAQVSARALPYYIDLT
jgi:hypothetical protein